MFFRLINQQNYEKIIFINIIDFASDSAAAE